MAITFAFITENEIPEKIGSDTGMLNI